MNENTQIKKIDFIKEELNKEIAKIRKKYKPNLSSIIKAYGGTHKNYKNVCYRFEFNNQEYILKIRYSS